MACGDGVFTFQEIEWNKKRIAPVSSMILLWLNQLEAG